MGRGELRGMMPQASRLCRTLLSHVAVSVLSGSLVSASLCCSNSACRNDATACWATRQSLSPSRIATRLCLRTSHLKRARATA